jgi:hypothetical protein
VSTPGDTFTFYGNVPFAFVGMDRSGDAVVGWTRNNDNSAQANIFDATPPSVTLSAPAGATTGQPAGFSAASSDLFSDVASIKWSFGDGSAGEGSALTHTYANPGVYTVTATSSDAVGNASSSSAQITVAAAAPAPHVNPPVVTAKCVVPHLTGLSSAAAKRRLLAAHCALGKVSISRRYKHAKRLVVSSQSVKAGKTLTAGTHVALTLKPPPPPPPHHKKHRH